MLNFFANGWVHLYRHKVSHSFIMTKNSMTIVGRGQLVEETPFTDEMFLKLWRNVTGNPDALIVSTDEYEVSN